MGATESARLANAKSMHDPLTVVGTLREPSHQAIVERASEVSERRRTKERPERGKPLICPRRRRERPRRERALHMRKPRSERGAQRERSAATDGSAPQMLRGERAIAEGERRTCADDAATQDRLRVRDAPLSVASKRR